MLELDSMELMVVEQKKLISVLYQFVFFRFYANANDESSNQKQVFWANERRAFKTDLRVFVVSLSKDKSLKLRHKGECSRKCGNGICLAVYDPVCASNGKTYSNLCRFKYAQCKDKSLKLISCKPEI